MREIVRALATVWMARPLAADSAEGIARWWFDWEGRVTNNELVAALDWLVRHELIAAVETVDGRCRYYRIAGDEEFLALLTDRDLH
jgi:hypothetical protein